MRRWLALALLLVACEGTMVREPEPEQRTGFNRGLFYVMDSRTRICFAVKTFNIASNGIVSSNVQSFSTVPCTPEVIALGRTGGRP